MQCVGTLIQPVDLRAFPGSFVWNSKVFSDPKEILEESHEDHESFLKYTSLVYGQRHGDRVRQRSRCGGDCDGIASGRCTRLTANRGRIAASAGGQENQSREHKTRQGQDKELFPA
jgi:hypothetical protein